MSDVASERISAAGIEVIAVCGSLRPASYTRAALRVALEGAAEAGASTRLLDLVSYDLPLCDGNEDPDSYPEGVSRLRADVGAARGILLGTPEYHGSYSGVLKNALDLMGFPELGGKMVGLVGVAGGAIGAHGALTELRSVCRSLHAWVVPQQCVIAQAWKQFADNGDVVDPKLRDGLVGVGAQVARFAALHDDQRYREFLQLWQDAPSNPGG